MIDLERFRLRAVVIMLSTIGMVGTAHADADETAKKDTKAQKETVEQKKAVQQEEDKSDSKTAKVFKEEDGVILLQEEDKKRLKKQPYCREIAPTGSRIKQRRCVSYEHRNAEEKAAKGYHRRATEVR